MQERSKNKQLGINLTASAVTFIVGLGIRFFLTPYIVSTLGAEAYGFIGLSANILSYTGLFTVALNSMAGRFICIKYTEGEIENANRFYSSVFYSNLVLAFLIFLFSLGCVIWLEYIVNIPDELVFDVKFLFSLLALNTILGLCTSIWWVSTFIKNRVDLSNIRNIIGNLLNGSVLLFLYSFLPPRIWYMGIAGLVLTLYTATANRKLWKILTPDLTIRRRYFDWEKVKTLLKSGSWNLLSSLGEILGQGLDLVIANLCIGVTAMGYFSLTKNVPFMILAFFQAISATFAPLLTSLYAQKKYDELKSEFLKTIRIMGFFAVIPITCLLVFGDNFYSLWLPSEDADKLQLITIIGSIGLVVSLPLEGLWCIFSVTNKLKYSTLYMVSQNVLVFLTLMVAMLFVDSVDIRLLVLAGARTFWGLIKNFFFLPLYGAHCLGYEKSIFYKPIFKSILCFVLASGLSYIIKQFVIITSWWHLLGVGMVVMVICVALNCLFILQKSDRIYFRQLIIRKK